MADGALSMFMTPEQYQLMQNSAQQQRAMQFAAMDPMQQAQYGMFLGGSQLGTALARGLGGQDQQLKLISQRQALSKDLDPSDPESLLKGAQRAAQMGDQEFAMNLSDYARKAASEIALARQRNEERRNAIAPDIQVAKYKGGLVNAIEALKDATDPQLIAQREAYQRELDALPVKGTESTTDIKNAEALALLKSARGTPEFNAEFASQLSRLTTKEGGKPTKVGLSKATGDAVFQDPNTDSLFMYVMQDGKQVRKPFVGGLDQLQAKTELSVSQTSEKAFGQKLGALDAEDVSQARKTRDNAIAAVEDLDRLAQLNDKGLIGGSFAAGRVGATNLLNTLGLISGKDTDRLSASEQFTKTANDLVLKAIGGKLGAGISNADRDFIRAIVPQLETSAAARRELINYMRKVNVKVAEEMNKLEDYARENNGLKGFKKTIPLQPGVSSNLSSMSTEELKAQRDRLRGNK